MERFLGILVELFEDSHWAKEQLRNIILVSARRDQPTVHSCVELGLEENIPLDYAITNSSSTIVNMLISAGARINDTDRLGHKQFQPLGPGMHNDWWKPKEEDPVAAYMSPCYPAATEQSTLARIKGLRDLSRTVLLATLTNNFNSPSYEPRVNISFCHISREHDETE
ncbi:hypothetical protein PCH_Pc24g02460 [Penicillium rubens Wisconsin 54-1255]|uniref:Uncharacterized protein n=1 Tax=Penicillium rubens (strain ATCC 28089 / DSM 1075 / NRRL 1951 / Wisconsin 54-1255) TaxID=500485 RepID=B6HX25_PENRW|nr:hypothetical protein PCH_Pc24g02460 [Penicillium rubens Wisconsin 54-1255]